MGPITCVIIGCLSLCYNVSDSDISIYQDTCIKNEHNVYSIPSSPSSSSLINSDIKNTKHQATQENFTRNIT